MQTIFFFFNVPDWSEEWLFVTCLDTYEYSVDLNIFLLYVNRVDCLNILHQNLLQK